MTEIIGLGLMGFSTNCLMVVLNVLGNEKDPVKLTSGWGWTHIFLGSMMVILGVLDSALNAGGIPSLSGYTGMAILYFGIYWIILGNILERGLDLRTVGHVSIPYAIVSIWLLVGAVALHLISLIILLVVLIVVFLLLWPATHGNSNYLKIASYLLIILAFLGFYIGFGLFYPGYTVF